MQSCDHFFPFNIHRINLASMQEVNFTPREIDIISCLIHVRGVKKISSYLSIAPNTVLAYFVITGISVYLKKVHKDLGERGGAKREEIVINKKCKKREREK